MKRITEKIKNNNNKHTLTIVGLCAAGLLFIELVAFAFGLRFTTSATLDKMDTYESSPEVYQSALSTVDLLHNQFALASNTYRDSAASAALQYQQALLTTIDSINKLADSYQGPGRGSFYHNLAKSFQSLYSHLLMEQALKPSSAEGTSSNSTSNSAFNQLKDQLIAKDNQIMKLETTIRNMPTPTGISIKEVDQSYTKMQQEELSNAKASLSEAQKQVQAMMEKNNVLQRENSKLGAQLTDFKKQSGEAEGDRQESIGKLKQQLQDLNTDLFFEKIDCNLTRADARKIISNARQRKELLTESLSMLAMLSKGGDNETQKKAKQKIDLLNQIAGTLHD